MQAPFLDLEKILHKIYSDATMPATRRVHLCVVKNQRPFTYPNSYEDYLSLA